MQSPFDNIVQHLFHQPSLHSVTVDELEHMAGQHPYFAAAQFLLLKKMQDTAHPQFTEQLQKTTIYFNNPLWLQYLLQPETPGFTVSEDPPFITSDQRSQPPTSEGYYNGHPSETLWQKEQIPAPESIEETPPQEILHEDIQPDSTDHQDPDNDTAPAEHHGVMDIISGIFGDANPLYNTLPVEDNIPIGNEELPASVVSDDTQTLPEHKEAAFTDGEETTLAEHGTTAPIARDINEHSAETIQPADAATSPAYQPGTNENIFDGQDVSQITQHPHTDPIDEPVTEQNLKAVISENTTYGVAENNTAPLPGTAAEHDDTERPAAEPDPDQHGVPVFTGTEKNAEETPLVRANIETPGARNDLLFEPYHTVDYFASQGIKLGKMEEGDKDRLGRQLKSFTDWLKTMKKLPQVSIDKLLAENEESKVVEDANHSLDNKEVVTEAMAEVFEKQGMNEKAAEIYRKLSLLNSAKSTYFAARIEALKS